MRWSKPALGLVIVVLCSAVSIVSAAPEPQLTVYTAQTSYSLPVLDRGGKTYIAVTDLLSPLEGTITRGKGKEWKAVLNKYEARLTEGKDKAGMRGNQVDLGGTALVENDRASTAKSADISGG